MDDDLIGKKIVSFRYMTKKELKREGWDDYKGVVLVLDDGTLIYPSRDEEGNGPGELFGYKDGNTFLYYPEVEE